MLHDLFLSVSRRRGVTVSPGWSKDAFVMKRFARTFAIAWPDVLVLRLPPGRVDELAALGWDRYDPRGEGTMDKEWIVVEDSSRAVELLREACEHAAVAAGPAAEAGLFHIGPRRPRGDT